MDFTEEQINRYSRHILLPEIGGKGQAKLLNSRVLVIGAGGVSNTICRYLVDKKFNFKIINRTDKHLEILLKRLDLGEDNIAQYSSI